MSTAPCHGTLNATWLVPDGFLYLGSPNCLPSFSCHQAISAPCHALFQQNSLSFLAGSHPMQGNRAVISEKCQMAPRLDLSCLDFKTI